MSRIGRMPIAIPTGVEVNLDGQVITVKKGQTALTHVIHPNMIVKVEDGVITVARPNDQKENRSLHGLTRTLIANMVIGVTTGFKKELEVNGVGYRVQVTNNKLNMNLGYSHPVDMTPPEGVTVEAPSANKIIVSGADKQKVGQFAAEIREKRLPEPYKGKGIKYADEVIRRKEGKTGGKKK